MTKELTGVPTSMEKKGSKMKVLRITAVTIAIVMLVYLLACVMFALRPIGTGSTSSGSTSSGSVTFTFNGSMEDALAECAAEIRKEYGANTTVKVQGTTLSYAISFPTPYGYDDVTDTITLSEDARFGKDACKLTNNLVVKERSAPLAGAPIHYLAHRTKQANSGCITHDLINKFTAADPTTP